MKVNAEKFSEFLALINISGELEIKECILRGDKDKLSVVAVHTASKALIVSGELKGDFSSIGVVGIDDLTMLTKMVKSFTGEIDVSATANKLVIKNGKKLNVELSLRNPQYVLNEIDKAKHSALVSKSIGNEFTLTPTQLTEFDKHYSVFGKHILISGDKNEVTFNISSGDNKLDLTLDVDSPIAKFEVKVNGFIMRVLDLIKSRNIKFSINDGSPSFLIASKTDDFEFNYIVAPMVK